MRPAVQIAQPFAIRVHALQRIHRHALSPLSLLRYGILQGHDRSRRDRVGARRVALLSRQGGGATDATGSAGCWYRDRAAMRSMHAFLFRWQRPAMRALQRHCARSVHMQQRAVQVRLPAIRMKRPITSALQEFLAGGKLPQAQRQCCATRSPPPGEL